LVHAVNALAMHAHTLARTSRTHTHTPRTLAFVKACAAFNQITIPSLLSPFTQTRLYLASAQVYHQSRERWP
jgi:hypothetical protein